MSDLLQPVYPPVLGQALPVDDVNDALDACGHDLGRCERPFGQQGWGLLVSGDLVAVALSASTVSSTAAGYARQEVVELARLCACTPWANRVMLRLWRECFALRWDYWPVRAAVSYQLNSKTGNLYRFDGWERLSENCGSTGGGTWSSKRSAGSTQSQRKTLWCWRYE